MIIDLNYEAGLLLQFLAENGGTFFLRESGIWEARLNGVSWEGFAEKAHNYREAYAYLFAKHYDQ